MIFSYSESSRKIHGLKSAKYQLIFDFQSKNLPSCEDILGSPEMINFQQPFLELHIEVYMKAYPS